MTEWRRARARQVEAWWAEGVDRKEIAERLSLTVGALSVELAHLRKLGFDLPRRPSPGRRPYVRPKKEPREKPQPVRAARERRGDPERIRPELRMQIESAVAEKCPMEPVKS